MTTAITEYKPLLEVIDTAGRRYYTVMSRDEFEQFLASEKEHIYFSITRRWVRKPYIVSYGPADEEVVLMEWALQGLSDFQKRCFDASKTWFLQYFWGTRALDQTRIDSFIDLAKQGRSANFHK